jgi:general secretion pathway protein H
VGPLIPAVAAPRRVRAFTLVELLVVIVVAGIAAGLIFANLGDDRRVAEREAARLAGALEHAADLAQWRGETLGVSADGRGYRFWQRGADLRWTALAGDDVLAPRVLPTELSVAPLAWAGAPVAADSILPLAASGRNEPYSLALASPAWTVVIAVDPLNRVHVAGGPPAASR